MAILANPILPIHFWPIHVLCYVVLLCVGVCFAVCLLFLVVVLSFVVVVRVGGVVIGLDHLAPDPSHPDPLPPDPFRRTGGFGAAGASHNNPRTPNVDI